MIVTVIRKHPDGDAREVWTFELDGHKLALSSYEFELLETPVSWSFDHGWSRNAGREEPLLEPPPLPVPQDVEDEALGKAAAAIVPDYSDVRAFSASWTSFTFLPPGEGGEVEL